jgi:hypothetical protein
MSNITPSAHVGWDKMSLKQKEIAATRSIVAVIEDLYNANDNEGLRVVSKNLKTLSDWVAIRRELLGKKLDIIARINSIVEHMHSNGIDEEFAEALETLSTLTADFLSDVSDKDEDDGKFADAVANIVEDMKKQEADFLATLEPKHKSA